MPWDTVNKGCLAVPIEELPQKEEYVIILTAEEQYLFSPDGMIFIFGTESHFQVFLEKSNLAPEVARKKWKTCSVSRSELSSICKRGILNYSGEMETPKIFKL